MNPKVILKSEKIKDLLVIQPEAPSDARGCNFEAYNEVVYNSLFERRVEFPVDSYARSVKDVIRGLHGDNVNWKLIDVLHGSAFFVVIDVNKESPTYLGTEELILSSENRFQVFLPPGCVNGHCVTSTECLFHYRLSKGFTRQAEQLSFKWNDPTFKINWPTWTPILSKRDA